MNLWQAVILGLVEGITEYLPISSTGHLIIASSLLGLDDPQVKASVDAFNIVVQGGAILAVLGLYWPRVVQMLQGLIGRDPAGFRLLVNVAVAFVPAAALGLLLDKWIEKKLFFPGPVIAALAIGGVYMMLVEQWRQGRFSRVRASSLDRGLDDLTPGRALVIGLMQCVAMWPGTSRSMMTITGGVVVGLRPAAAAEFSFLLALPTLGAACLYKLARDQLRAGKIGPDGVMHEGMFTVLGVMPAVVGIAVAAISAAAAVKWLVGFLNRHGLTPFGWYRIVLAVALLGLIVGGVVKM